MVRRSAWCAPGRVTRYCSICRTVLDCPKLTYWNHCRIANAMEQDTTAEFADSRKLAALFFNEAWKYIEKPDRTADDDLLMIHLAHASRLHWQFAGDASRWTIGEWQISRVYSILKRSEPALYHARISLRIATENNVRPFLLGCAHEAIARALSITADPSVGEHIARASNFARQVEDAEEKAILEGDLSTIPRSNLS